MFCIQIDKLSLWICKACLIFTIVCIFDRFSHLISIDFFDDLFNVLNELVVSDVSIPLCRKKILLFEFMFVWWAWRTAWLALGHWVSTFKKNNAHYLANRMSKSVYRERQLDDSILIPYRLGFIIFFHKPFL